MASLTQAQQEDAFAQHTYESARAAGRAAKLVGEGIISARFVYATPGSADVGLGTFDLSAVALDLKSLSQIALHVGAQYEGRSLFALDLVKSGDLYDALFSEQQFSDFKESYTAELEALSAQGHTKIDATFRLRKLAEGSDVSAAKNVDTGRKRLHWGTEAGWQDGPAWAAKRLKETQPKGSERQLGGQVAEERRTQLLFFGDALGSKSGLVSDGLLKSGGLDVFGVKANWTFDSSAGWTEAVAPQPDSSSGADAAEAEAVKHFVWLHRVGNDYNLMKRYTKHFSSTEGLLKLLRGLRMLEVDAKSLYKTYVNDLIGAKTFGVAALESKVFSHLEPLPAGGIAGYKTRIGSVLTAVAVRDQKKVDINPGALLSKGMELYCTAAFSLRDEVLTSQVTTLIVQISALERVMKEIIGIRFPALLKAHALTAAHALAVAKLPHAEVGAARAALQRDVAAVFANLPMVIDAETYDAPKIISVGLSARVVPGEPPSLVDFKDMFLSSNLPPMDGPASLFGAALAAGLDNTWFSPTPPPAS